MRFREPLLLPFIAFASGTVLSTYQHFTPFESLAPLTAFLFLTGIATLSGVRLPLRLAVILLTCFSAGIWNSALHETSEPPRLSVADNAPAIFEGCVVDPALVAADRERFTIELAPGARAQVSLYSRAGFPDLPYGSRIEFQGKIRTTHNYNNPGSFDSVYFLARQNIYWNASGSAETVKRLPGSCGNRVLASVFHLRSIALERIDSLFARDPYAAGMMEAILVGVTAKLERAWTVDYRSTGTFHALVISGSHVAVLAAVLLFFVRICAIPRA